MLFPAVASLPRIVAVAASASTGIELLQWVLAIGRVSSVDDIVVNTLGAGLAALLSRPWWADRKGDNEKVWISVA